MFTASFSTRVFTPPHLTNHSLFTPFFSTSNEYPAFMLEKAKSVLGLTSGAGDMQSLIVDWVEQNWVSDVDGGNSSDVGVPDTASWSGWSGIEQVG
jgi:hypothetical protein